MLAGTTKWEPGAGVSHVTDREPGPGVGRVTDGEQGAGVGRASDGEPDMSGDRMVLGSGLSVVLGS